MKPLSWDKQLGLASPLECAAIQSGQDQNPLRRENGLDANHHIHVSPGGRGRIFFLTSSLIGQLTRRGWLPKSLVRNAWESLLTAKGQSRIEATILQFRRPWTVRKSVRIVETGSRDRVDSSGIGEKSRPLPCRDKVQQSNAFPNGLIVNQSNTSLACTISSEGFETAQDEN